jgi:hypothetical protein
VLGLKDVIAGQRRQNDKLQRELEQCKRMNSRYRLALEDIAADHPDARRLAQAALDHKEPVG